MPSFPLIIAHSIVRNSHSAAAVGRGLSHLASLRMRYGGGGPLFTLGALTRKLLPGHTVGMDLSGRLYAFLS